MHTEVSATYAEVAIDQISIQRSSLIQTNSNTHNIAHQQYALVAMYTSGTRSSTGNSDDKQRQQELPMLLAAASNPLRLPPTVFRHSANTSDSAIPILLDPSLVHSIKVDDGAKIELVVYLLPDPAMVMSSTSQQQDQSQIAQRRDEAKVTAPFLAASQPLLTGSGQHTFSLQYNPSRVADTVEAPPLLSVTGTALPNVTPEVLALLHVLDSKSVGKALTVLGRAVVDIEVSGTVDGPTEMNLSEMKGAVTARVSVKYFSNYLSVGQSVLGNKKEKKDEVVVASMSVEASGWGADLITAMAARAQQQRRFNLAEALRRPSHTMSQTQPQSHGGPNVSNNASISKTNYFPTPHRTKSVEQHLPKVLMNGGSRWAATTFDCPSASLIAQAITNTDPFTAAGAISEALDPRAAALAVATRGAGSLLQAPAPTANGGGGSGRLRKVSTPLLPLLVETCGQQTGRAARKDKFQSNSFAIAVMEPIASQHIENDNEVGDCGVPSTNNSSDVPINLRQTTIPDKSNPAAPIIDIPRLPIAVAKFTAKDIHRWLTREYASTVGTSRCTFYDERVKATVTVEEAVFEGDGPSHGEPVLKISVKMSPTATDEEIESRLREQEDEEDAAIHLHTLHQAHPQHLLPVGLPHHYHQQPTVTAPSLRTIAARRAAKNAASLHKNTVYTVVIIIHSMQDWLIAMRGEYIGATAASGDGLHNAPLPWELVLQGARGRAKAAKQRQRAAASVGNAPFASKSERREALWLLRVQRWQEAIRGVQLSLPVRIGEELSASKQSEASSSSDSDTSDGSVKNASSIAAHNTHLHASSSVLRAHFETVLGTCIDEDRKGRKERVADRADPDHSMLSSVRVGQPDHFMSPGYYPDQNSIGRGGYNADDAWRDQPSMLQHRSTVRDERAADFHSPPNVGNPIAKAFPDASSSPYYYGNPSIVLNSPSRGFPEEPLFNDLSPPMGHRTGYSLNGYSMLRPPVVHERHLSPLGHGHYLPATFSPQSAADTYVASAASPMSMMYQQETPMDYSAKKISDRLARADLTMGREEQLRRGGVGPMSSVAHVQLPYQQQPMTSLFGEVRPGYTSPIANRTLASLEDRMANNSLDGMRPNDYLNLRSRATVGAARAAPQGNAMRTDQSVDTQRTYGTSRLVDKGNSPNAPSKTILDGSQHQVSITQHSMLSQLGLVPQTATNWAAPTSTVYNANNADYLTRTLLNAEEQPNPLLDLRRREQLHTHPQGNDVANSANALALASLPQSISLAPSDVLFLMSYHHPSALWDIAPLYYTALFGGILHAERDAAERPPASFSQHHGPSSLHGTYHSAMYSHPQGHLLYRALQAAGGRAFTTARTDTLSVAVANAATQRRNNRTRSSQLATIYAQLLKADSSTSRPSLLTHLFAAPELESLLAGLLEDPHASLDVAPRIVADPTRYLWTAAHLLARTWLIAGMYAAFFFPALAVSAVLLTASVVGVLLAGHALLYGKRRASARKGSARRRVAAGGFMSLFGFGGGPLGLGPREGARVTKRGHPESSRAELGISREDAKSAVRSPTDLKQSSYPWLIKVMFEPLSILTSIPYLTTNGYPEEELVNGYSITDDARDVDVDVQLDGSGDPLTVADKKIHRSQLPNAHHSGFPYHRHHDPYNPFHPSAAQHPAARLIPSPVGGSTYSMYGGEGLHHMPYQGELSGYFSTGIYPQRVYPENLLNFNGVMQPFNLVTGTNSRSPQEQMLRPARTALLAPQAATAGNQALSSLTEAAESYRIYRALGLVGANATALSNANSSTFEIAGPKVSLDILAKILTIALIKGQEIGSANAAHGNGASASPSVVSSASAGSISVRARRFVTEGRCLPLWLMLLVTLLGANAVAYVLLWKLSVSLSTIGLLVATLLLVPRSPMLMGARLFLRLFLTAEELN